MPPPPGDAPVTGERAAFGQAGGFIAAFLALEFGPVVRLVAAA